jgi:hypothetical protein
MMHDPAVFPEPDKFDPERWLSPVAPAYPNPAFGFGARRCPGRFFAHASMWLMTVGILAAFDITPTEDGPPEEKYMSGFVSYEASSTVPRNEWSLMSNLQICEAFPLLYSTTFGGSGFASADDRE